MIRRLVRLCTLAVAAAGLLLVPATPAVAHGRGTTASNFLSRITQAPDLAGVTFQVVGSDQYLAVTNTSDTMIEVPGYDDTLVVGDSGGTDPYLRIGPQGVEVNQASRANHVNADRFGHPGEPLPPNVGVNQPPRWTTVSDTPVYSWHDHRIHWMAPGLPPAVTDPAQRTEVSTWTVVFTSAGTTYEVKGELLWVPGPSLVPWLGLAALVTFPALLGLWRVRRGGWDIRLARPAAAVLLAVSLCNVVHLVDDLVALPRPITQSLPAAVQTALFIAMGVLGAVAAWRGRAGAFTALGVGAGAIFVGQGLLYLGALRASGMTTVFPDGLTRLAIAMSLVQVVPVGVLSVLGSRRVGPPVAAVDAATVDLQWPQST